MYFTAGEDNRAYALDARTGRTLWIYQRVSRGPISLCCGRVNRGLAILGHTLFLATMDAHVVALNAKNGRVMWETKAAEPGEGYSFTGAPLVVKDKVVVGVAGGEFGIRGFIDAYDTGTGKRAWRFETIPAGGEPGHDSWGGNSSRTGGGPAWVTGAYDPDLNLLYWGTGNPSPAHYGAKRAGANLYTNSVVALNPDTGKLSWFYQFTPHDTYDFDATHVPLLVDIEFRGQRRKLFVQANRNGFYYILDRATGQFLFAKPFGRVTWAKEIGSDGRPVTVPNAEPSAGGTFVCPGAGGATNWMSPSFSPETGLVYVSYTEQCSVNYAVERDVVPGVYYAGGIGKPAPGERDWGALLAIEPATGEVRWSFKYHRPPWGGVLTTAGGLAFHGNDEGYFFAFDARTGADLWHVQTGAAIKAAPVTYQIAGKQYVVICSGTAVFAFGIPQPGR